MSNVDLKFIFANYEGQTVNMNVSTNITVKELKVQLINNFPKGIYLNISEDNKFDMIFLIYSCGLFIRNSTM